MLATRLVAFCCALGLCNGLIKIRISPFELYATAGSHGLPELLHCILGSMEMGDVLWKLLTHSKLDFLTYWEQTCDIMSPHPLSISLESMKESRFMTPHCLFALRASNSEYANELLKSSDTRSVLDLRSFQNESPFDGDNDGFAQKAFLEAAWGYGSAIPYGQWCSSLRWRSFFPKDVWPLMDVECLEAMDHRRRYKIAAIDLISDDGRWSIFRESPDYKLASLRFLHFMMIELELRARPWLKRWNKIVRVAKDDLYEQIRAAPASDSPWFNIFVSLVKGNWSGKLLRSSLLPELRKDKTLKRSFQNRMVLYFMSVAWAKSGVSERDKAYVKVLFVGLLHDAHVNPAYLAKFLETVTMNSDYSEYAPVVELAIQHYRQSGLDKSYHISYSLWEIFFRHRGYTSHGTELLSLISLRERTDLALKSLRYIYSNKQPTFYAKIPSASHQFDFMWKNQDVLPGILTDYNNMILEKIALVPGPNSTLKMSFGMTWTQPCLRTVDFSPLTKRHELCIVIEKVLKHLLASLEPNNIDEAYRYAYDSSSANTNHIVRFANLFTMAFAYRCTLPRTFLPDIYGLPFERFTSSDKTNITGNWLSATELYNLIVI